MRRLLITTTLGLLAVTATATSAAASIPPSTDPADGAATAELAPAPDSSGAPAVTVDRAVPVVDSSGTPVASVTLGDVEPAWTGFAEGDEPDSGFEYLRITVVVESLTTRGLYAVDADDFVVQDADGFTTRPTTVPTAAEDAADTDPVTETELPTGETVELALTFEVVGGVATQALYYTPGNDRLITIAELG